MEKILLKFEQIWFETNILSLKNPHQEMSNEEKPYKETQQQLQKLGRSSSQLMVRSFSDQSLSLANDTFTTKGDVSPDSVLPTKQKRLQTIVSGKESDGFEDKMEGQKHGSENRESKKKWRNKREKRRCSKSLSELEFEELQGFMDLGFVFFEEDKDSILGSIIPGLQRIGKNDHDHNCPGGSDGGGGCRISRPYLSEAWEILDRKKKVNDSNDPLKNWRIPSELIGSEIDMKNHLKFWAHTVASTVK